jgi:hypothetical protein
MIKKWLYDLEQEQDQPELDDLMKYELYCLYKDLYEKDIDLEYFEPLMEEGE